MKNEKKSSSASQALPDAGEWNPLAWGAILVAVILGCLFWQDFKPNYVLFSNDCPYGGLVAEDNRMPSIMVGLWADSNWLGSEGLSQPPAITSLLRLLTSPLMYAKLLTPVVIFIAGICACFCFRAFKFTPVACILGGLAVALNSDFFSTANWGVGSQVVGFGCMFLAVGLLGAPMKKRTWIRVVLAGLAVGLGVIEAYDIGALFSLVVAAFAIYQSVFLNDDDQALPIKVGRGVARTALVAVFAGMIALPALNGLIGTQVVGISGSGQDAETKKAQWDAKTQWSVPKAESLQVAVPGLFGYRDNWYMYENDSPTDDQYWGTVGMGGGLFRLSGTGFYAGNLVLMLVIWAIVQSFRGDASPFTRLQRRGIWFWSAVALITLLLAFGYHAPFYQFFYALPYASTMRNPAKFMHVFTWAFLIVFGYGLHGLTMIYFEYKGSRVGGLVAQFKSWFANATAFERKWLIGCLIAVGVSLLGWLVYGSYNKQLLDYVQTVGISETDAPGVVKFSQHSVGWFVFLLMLTIGALALVVSGQFTGARAKWGGVLLGALLVFDLGRADIPWISYWDLNYKYAIDPIVKRLADKPYEHRVAMFPLPMNNQQFALLQNQYMSDWKQHIFLHENIECADVVQEPRIAEDKERFMNALVPTNIFNLLRFWQLSSTRYILAAGGDFVNRLDPSGKQFKLLQAFNFVPKGANAGQWPEDYTAQPDTNGQLGLIEFNAALPRAKLFSSWHPKTSDEDALRAISSPAFDPLSDVVVADDIPAPTAADAGQPAGTVEINPNYKSKRIELEADVKTPAILLLTDRYNPKWRVEVDGQPAKLLRCDYILRGVRLEPGKHVVVFRFENLTGSLFVGIAAMVLGLGLWGFLAFCPCPEEEEPVPAAPAELEQSKVPAKQK